MAFGNVTFGSAAYGSEEGALVVELPEGETNLTGTGTMSATALETIGGAFPAPDPGLVPLTVRAGTRHITREISGVQIRREAIGGVKSISLRLSRPLNRFDPFIRELADIRVFDSRSGEYVGQAKITDLGRAASASDGQQWDIVAFGPAQHAADKRFPYVPVTTSLEPFRRSAYCTRNGSTGTDERDASTPSLILSADEGKTVSTSWVADMINRVMREARMKLARVSASIDSGVTDGGYELQLVTRTDAGSGTVADTATASTTPAVLAGQVVTDFTSGQNVVSVRVLRNISPTTGAEAHWFEFYNIALRAMLLDTSGAEITTGYTANTVFAHEVAADLVGRILDQFDGPAAVIDTSGTFAIDQLDYRDGVTAEQVLNDLMLLEPGFRWWAEPNPDPTGGYIFHWAPWPTEVRYEVSLEDGASFPTSTQDLYNEVTVRWRDKNGQTRTTQPITAACAILDQGGVTRSTIIDLGDEIGSDAAATRAGENFLAEHNVPPNAGTLAVNRPILDLLTGRMVRQHQIREAELIRVRGIESYPDALNASSNDGVTVFRIWTATYTSDNDTAVLELDTPSRSTTNALAKLAKRHPRKR